MIARIEQWVQRLRRDERGLTTVEYAIVLCLIAALAVASWKAFGEMVEGKLTESTDHIDNSLDIP